MVSDIYYGKLSDYAKKHWYDMKDPFNVLEWQEVIKMGSLDFLLVTKDNFTDQVQLDWGSFAWKCSKAALICFFVTHKLSCEIIDKLDENDEYGVVFIEEV